MNVTIMVLDLDHPPPPHMVIGKVVVSMGEMELLVNSVRAKAIGVRLSSVRPNF